MSQVTSPPRGVLGPVLAAVAAVVVCLLILLDPLGVHGLDEWAMSRLGYQKVEAPPEPAEQGLWTCPMHSHILEDHEGECPVCGMDLVPVDSELTGAGSAEREVVFYRNPMDPTITSLVPAKDEMGMDYVPVYADEAREVMGAGTEIRIDPGVVQNMNVQTEVAEVRDLSHDVRTVGYLEYDQERMVTVTTKYAGWVEKVYVNYVGENVRRGQPLFEIYSPELVQTEQELLSALEYERRVASAPEEHRRRARGLVDAARTRLEYWDISPSQIQRLEETGQIFRTLRVVAPSTGVVMQRVKGLEGRAVQPGTDVYHIADLSALWLSVEIFESQLTWIDQGTPAEVSFTYFPSETFTGTVRYIEPEFSEKTRTLRAKIEVPNAGGRLRAGMFATVVFKPTVAERSITIPSLSVLRTGQRDVVVVALGEGRFAPREVELGHSGQGYVEVLSGVEAGERVVTSAQFLLDSEASLQEAIRKMMAARSADPGSAGPPATGAATGHDSGGHHAQ